jgi:hypothetical protein
VAEALRSSGDEEAIGALEAAANLGDALEPLVELAEASGVGPFTALDLVVEFSNPGRWREADERASELASGRAPAPGPRAVHDLAVA